MVLDLGTTYTQERHRGREGHRGGEDRAAVCVCVEEGQVHSAKAKDFWNQSLSAVISATW